MSEPGEITRWVNHLKEGDRAVVQQLWENYFHRLVQLARQQLQGLPRKCADEEDVALSAFKSFCLAAEQNRFPKLNDRDDLWQILVMLTRNKAVNLRQHQTRDKRDINREINLAAAVPEEGTQFLNLIEGQEPDPAFAAEMAEQCQRLLAMLADDELRQIALLKLEGYTNQEIADQMQCALATIERRLGRIRRCWEEVQNRQG
jgi:RNA polymerase sigma factor (sigma-70 family)